MDIRIPKGFRDMLPEEALLRNNMIAESQQVFQSYGYLPIDTPILEYSHILLGKSGGETEKQMYRFQDNGGRDLALRFDLTVPFARFLSMHSHQLIFPFRRFHIGKVFRGENTQRGRYREFIQCDFDVVGSSSFTTDLEILMVAASTLHVLQTGSIAIHISHKKLIEEILQMYCVPQTKYTQIFRAIDKIHKTGLDIFKKSMENTLDHEILTFLLFFLKLRNEDLIQEIESIKSLTINNLATYFRNLQAMSSHMGSYVSFIFDPTIVRGLDYYTGMVFECFLIEEDETGALCSGGRYDSLTSVYTHRKLPCVGGSIGIDRVLACTHTSAVKTKISILILNLGEDFLSYYYQLAAHLREKQYTVEIFPDVRKLAKQLQYAEKKKISYGVICGSREIESHTLMLRNIQKKENTGPHTWEALSHLLY